MTDKSDLWLLLWILSTDMCRSTSPHWFTWSIFSLNLFDCHIFHWKGNVWWEIYSGSNKILTANNSYLTQFIHNVQKYSSLTCSTNLHSSRVKAKMKSWSAGTWMSNSLQFITKKLYLVGGYLIAVPSLVVFKNKNSTPVFNHLHLFN